MEGGPKKKAQVEATEEPHIPRSAADSYSLSSPLPSGLGLTSSASAHESFLFISSFSSRRINLLPPQLIRSIAPDRSSAHLLSYFLGFFSRVAGTSQVIRFLQIRGVAMASRAVQLGHTAATSSRIMDPSSTLRSVCLRPQSVTKLFLRRSTRDGAGAASTARVVIALKDPAAQDSLKRAVAKKAVELVKSGMVVGLGTGSTSCMAIEELGILISQNKLKDVECVATSYQSRVLSRQFGVKTVDLNDVNHIDIAFDGADEVDSSMNLIKGGGAAHTMEKVVDSIAKHCVILVDETKVVKTLGLTFPVPVEVLPFALAPVLRALAALGGQPEIRTALRKDGPVMTDLGNMVVDVRFPEGVQNPAELEKKINMIPGVVENGLFINVAHTVLVGTKDGDETSVVEFADFVETLRSTEEVSAS